MGYAVGGGTCTVDYMVQRKCRRHRILAEMYIFRRKHEMFCTTRWDPILPESSRNVRLHGCTKYYRQNHVRFFFADLTRKSSGGGTNSGFFGISQHFRCLSRFSEMISSDQTRSESVFTGRPKLVSKLSSIRALYSHRCQRRQSKSECKFLCCCSN